MNQINKFCPQKGHEWFQVNQICTYRLCNMKRWCCQQCVHDQIHNHFTNSNHIMNETRFSDKLKKDIQKFKKEYIDSKQATYIKNLLSKMVREVSELEKIIIAFRQNIERQQYAFMSYGENFRLIQQLLQKVEEQNFIQIKEDDINILLNINFYYHDDHILLQLQEPFDKIQQQLNILQQDVKEYQENIGCKIMNVNSMKYNVLKIHEQNDDYIISLISKNQQYLIYYVQNCTHIYNLKMKKIQKKIFKQFQLQNGVSSFQFTDDSKILFAGDDEGFVYGYFVQNRFKIFYKQKIHQKQISQIITQKQYIITASWDQTIIKTNFIKKIQIFILVGHNFFVSIDYDFQKDIIISSSYDNTMKIWDCLNQSVLIDLKTNNRWFKFIQFTNNNQDVVCHIDNEIQKFTIYYQDKSLVQTLTYHEKNRIFGFQQVNNDQNLLLICNQYCKILNNTGELIHIIYHNVNIRGVLTINYRQQSDHLNYIILSGYQLHLLQASHMK